VTALDLRNVRAIVTDANVLGRLDPAAVAAYLQRTGWFRAHERRGSAVWSRWLGDHAVKLLVPNDPTFGDYPIRMSEVLAALALTEDRSQLSVLADLCEAAKRRAVTPGEGAGPPERTDWMEPEYGLRRPELALVLDLAACRVDRAAFVLELERLQWPLSEAAELADLVAECELTAAESARAGGEKEGNRG
jgi:hypothetical protein